MQSERSRKITLYKALLLSLLLAVFVFVPAVSAMADFDKATPPPEKRTLYVIGDINGSGNFPLIAYITVANDLYWADSWYAMQHNLGPVGLAVDEVNENLFVSYESSDLIEVFGARDATPLGTIYLYGTDDLAGMDVHQDRGHLYVVDRRENDVFVFDTTTFSQLDHWVMPTGAGAWGIDLLGDELFMADQSTTVRWYNIDSQTETGNFTLNYPAVAIAVTDYPEPLIYTTAFDGGSGMHPYLSKTSIYTGIQTHVPVGSDPKGVSLNPAQNVAYVVADNRVHVVDSVNMAILATKQLNWSWSPTDCLATFIPFAGTVKKTCTSHPGGKIKKGDQVTFNIAIQNRHARPIHVLPVTDTYDNTQLYFVSSDPPADDSNDDGQLDWSDIIAQIGADLPTGQWAEIEVVFDAIEDCEAEILTGVNVADIHDVEDDQGTVLPDATGEFNYRIDCNCKTNAECDDSVFCNGAEICKADGSCESPGNPCPLDDGLWCNGTETDVCDEKLQECEHINPPCVNDELWCNGEDICNENTDTCVNSGPPCKDDGQFCNGDETCNEDDQECVSSGDPCEANEECNESTDSCDAVDVTDDDSPTPEPEGDDELWPTGKVTGGCCGCE